MADMKDIYWLAGLLEGEGCFALRNSGHNPVIQLVMTDEDVVVTAAKIMGAHKVVENKQRTKSGKNVYRTVLYGNMAIGWMMTLYSLMGARRKKKIVECIELWKQAKISNYPNRKPYSRGAKVVWSHADSGLEVCHR